ncbi:kinase-like domain-containing protein [Rhizophagus irregularis DAOM 181602=DAOM 197198]|uniref:Protein kinase domain-containing protein n=1 Tax=Rhizophagus irregularis (strain DAOM 181602 / DAOM 197198 / MUCL 43194) TaxID=747089 RepID=U9U353_RHIID|nr:kinase-like domain-containing protein [Rhizophagus irregularis DAOM 181602=DAOM 197198]
MLYDSNGIRDGGSLRNYQLACGVLCLHNRHSGNILVHQKTIKLADFGLSKNHYPIYKKKVFGMVPCIDQNVGVLLWEISSGRLPFCDEKYDLDLASDISQKNLREAVVPALFYYYNIMLDGEPDNCPTIYQVSDLLKANNTRTNIITKNLQSSSKQELNSNDFKGLVLSINKSELHGELSLLMNNFDELNIFKDLKSSLSTYKSELHEDLSKDITISKNLSENDYE